MGRNKGLSIIKGLFISMVTAESGLRKDKNKTFTLFTRFHLKTCPREPYMKQLFNIVGERSLTLWSRSSELHGWRNCKTFCRYFVVRAWLELSEYKLNYDNFCFLHIDWRKLQDTLVIYSMNRRSFERGNFRWILITVTVTFACKGLGIWNFHKFFVDY